MLRYWPVRKRAGHLVSMALSARLALVTLVIGCSPRVIDAVIADETCCTDGGGGDVKEAATPASDVSDAPVRHLIHRYSFAGLFGETSVKDTGVMGGANANIYNASLSGTGFVALPGGLNTTQTPAYVDLPNFLISRLQQATLEIWVSWTGTGGEWQRVFDFGEDISGADLDAAPRIMDPNDHTRDGRSYLYMTPMSGAAATPPSVLRLAYLKPEDAVPRMSGVTTREPEISDTQALATGLRQIDVTIDGQSMSLFVQGTPVGRTQLTGTLADIYDVNCWLGRSQYPADPLFAGNIHDFRIYDAALTPDQIRRNGSAGAGQPAVE